jgi:glutamyl-tRNA synthetase
VFDLDKLTWMNGRALRRLAPEAWLERLRAGLLGDDYLLRVLPLVQERVDTLEAFFSYASFFFVGEVEYDAEAREKLVARKRTAAETAGALERLLEETLDPLLDWDAEVLETALRGFLEASGWTPKELFMPIRVAVTGRPATPPLFETMAVLGKEVCRRRLRRAAELLRGDA